MPPNGEVKATRAQIFVRLLVNSPCVLSERQLRDLAECRPRGPGHALVWTNGCFDLLHAGHLDLLERAADMGPYLIVGLNSDASITRLKGAGRPIIPEAERVAHLLAIRYVTWVTIYDSPLPNALIGLLEPEVVVKGGDWTEDELPEHAVIQQYGGALHLLEHRVGVSTTGIIRRIQHGPA